MYSRIGVLALGVLVLSACAPHSPIENGAVVLEEQVALSRGSVTDGATRTLEVDSDSILVATVDENLTDVALRISIPKSAEGAATSIEVENHLDGAGIEIAMLAIPAGTRAVLTLTGPASSSRPGSVHLRVRQYSNDARRDALFAAQLAAFDAWSAGTRAADRRSAYQAHGLEDLARAIKNLESPHGDPQLAAEARLIRANALGFFALDFRESRAEAQRAAQAFEKLAQPDTLNIARARFCEALALSGIAQDRTAVNPTSEEAAHETRRILGELFAATSPFASLERAHAHAALGSLALNLAQNDEAQQHLEAARTLYDEIGYVAGEIEMRADLAHVLAQRGRRFEAAQQLEKMLPEIDRITDPVKRIEAFGSLAGAQLSSGRADEAVDILLKAIAQAREYELPLQEAGGLQMLGYNYFYRGDFVQAKAFLEQALKVARTRPGTMELVFALQGAGIVARYDGDHASALALHTEAVTRSTNPIVRMRTIRHVALDHLAAGNPAEAIAQFRAALAVDLHDPEHYAYSDIRRELGEALLMHGDGSRATLAEAEALANRAVRQSVDVQDKLGEISAHHVMAMLRVQQGRLAAARAEYEKTFELVFEYRDMSRNPQFRIGSMEQELAAFRGYFDLVTRDVVAAGGSRPRAASPDEEDALRMLERAREVRVGVTRSGAVDPASVQRVNKLLERMAVNSLATARLLARTRSADEDEQLTKLQLDTAGLRAELDRERTAASDKLVSLEKSRGEVRQWRALQPGMVQLSYALGNDRAYVWARDARGLRIAVLSETPQKLEKRLIDLAAIDRQKSPDAVEQALAQLSTILLPAGLLGPDSTALEIIAEGRIAGVPFSGLRSPASPAGRLVETHAIKMTTSMFAVDDAQRPAQARPFRLVALASGSGTLRSAPTADPAPRLQAAIAEIDGIAQLFESANPLARVKLLIGNDGSAAQLHAIWSSGADVVHFATHALADLRQPLASLLVLPAKDAAGSPAYLTAGQVQDWRGDAELVFLSACESAIGPPRFAGGMPGLQSAFLRAGARGVIATLWPIEDVLARQFTADFYQRFTRGKAAVQALGETQRLWLAPKAGASEAEQVRRRITAMAHAYFSI
jgi:CHAT domain-containing protein/tetratricopeptide (TPR) repeat protein